MPPGGIVEAFDEAEAGHACLDRRGKAAPVDEFAFEGGKEALAQGVIVSIPDRAHRGPRAGFLAALAESQRGILGGIKWSSHHLDGRLRWALGSGARIGPGEVFCVRRVDQGWRSVRIGGGSGRRSRRAWAEGTPPPPGGDSPAGGA